MRLLSDAQGQVESDIRMAVKRAKVVAAAERPPLAQMQANNARMTQQLAEWHVGLNIEPFDILCDLGALVSVLVEKGVLTQGEWEIARAQSRQAVLSRMLQQAEEERAKARAPQIVTPGRSGLQIVRH